MSTKSGVGKTLILACLVMLGIGLAVVSPRVFFLYSRATADPTEYLLNQTVLIDLGNGGHGSGVVVSNRRVLTAAHVVRNRETVAVVFRDGRTIGARVLWRGSEGFDMAALALDGDAGVPPASISCRPPKIGAQLLAIGHPDGGRWVASTFFVTGGKWPYDKNSSTINIAGAIGPGMSGGPVFDPISGQVFGLTTHMNLMSMFFGFPPLPTGFGGMVAAAEACKLLKD